MNYRQPDPYIQQRLVNNPSTSSSNELEECLQISMLQYIENSIIDHAVKYTELYEKYKQILLKYKRLNQYDSKIKDFTSYIEPIMDDYSKHGIPIHLDEESYVNMMSIINSIRLSEEEKELMNQLFSKY
jgi:hypothetical protein